MKKFLKTSLLVLFTAMLFAGCKNQTSESGPSANTPIEEEEFKSANWLTDGVWFIDESSTQRFSGIGQSEELKTSSHIEMEIEGEEIRIIKATQTYDGEEIDITAQMQNSITSKQEALSQGQDVDYDVPDDMPFSIDNIEPEVKFYKNEDGTEYRITINIHLNYADLMKEMYESQGLPFDEEELAVFDMTMDSYSEVIYKKQ